MAGQVRGKAAGGELRLVYRFVRIPRLVPRLMSAVKIADERERRRICRRCLRPYKSAEHQACRILRQGERQIQREREIERMTRPKSQATVGRIKRQGGPRWGTGGGSGGAGSGSGGS